MNLDIISEIFCHFRGDILNFALVSKLFYETYKHAIKTATISPSLGVFYKTEADIERNRFISNAFFLVYDFKRRPLLLRKLQNKNKLIENVTKRVFYFGGIIKYKKFRDITLDRVQRDGNIIKGFTGKKILVLDGKKEFVGSC